MREGTTQSRPIPPVYKRLKKPSWVYKRLFKKPKPSTYSTAFAFELEKVSKLLWQHINIILFPEAILAALG